MKRLWIALGLLVFVIGMSVWGLLWQVSALDHLEQALERAETAVWEQRENAEQLTAAFRRECFQITARMAALSRHVDSSPLRESAAQLPLLLQQDNTDHFFAEAARCRFYIQELRRSEKPLLGNIF